MKKSIIERSIIKSLDATNQSPDPRILDAAKEEMRTRKQFPVANNNSLRFAIVAVVVVVFAVVLALPFVFNSNDEQSNNGDKEKTGIPLRYVVAYADGISYESFTEDEDAFSMSDYYGNFATIIETMQQLFEMDGAHGNLFSADSLLNRQYYTELYNKMNEYDDEFFNKKELLFVSISFEHNEWLNLNNVELIDNELVVTVEKPRVQDEVSPEDITYIFVIELDKMVGKRDVRIETIEVDDFFCKEYYQKAQFNSYGYVVVGSNIVDESKRTVRLQTQGMIEIEIDAWYFTFGIPNNRIIVKYSGDNADAVTFTCKTNAVSLFDGDNGWHQEKILYPNESVIWWDSECPDQAFIDVVVRKDEYIIGYALVSIQKTEGLDYKARVTESAIFPIVNGKYQNITDSYVETLLEKAKKED